MNDLKNLISFKNTSRYAIIFSSRRSMKWAKSASLKISVATLRQTGYDPNYWLISKAQEVKKGKKLS